MQSTHSQPANGRRFHLVAALLLLVAGLSGCAQFPKQAFNKDLHTDVKRVALLEPAAPKEYVAFIQHHPGASFGLLGGIIAAADMQSKTSELTGKFQERKFSFAEVLNNALDEELRKHNYEVIRVKPERPQDGLLDDYSALQVDADAYLDWVINWNGYIAAAATSDYLPSARVAVRLIRPGTKEVMYSELIGYGFQFGVGEPIALQASPKYRYANFSRLIELNEEAETGLREGVPLIAQQIAADLAGR